MDMAIERTPRNDRWDDEGETDKAWGEPPSGPLTREQAMDLRARHPPLSPWRVVAVQAALGVVVALSAGWLTARQEVFWSVLYGAVTVVLPGVLMARGMTSRLSSVSPGASAAGLMVWESVKIAVAVAMLVLAPRLVQLLSWPALLVGMVVCMKVYWLALLWRPGRKNQRN